MNTLPEPEKGGLPMGKIRAVAILLAIAAVVVSIMREEPQSATSRAPKPPVAADFEGNWRRATNTDLSRTMALARIDDCPDLAYRAHKTSQGQFLVYCSSDGGRRWVSWLVWTGTQKVLGPFAPDPLLPVPL
ncbi:hypothetical protein FN976_13680 [Caenimonas sedimenti]|uniref:Uncharacterized protein n=1 Tax=Caenimonas sedimenti TaxID=2596921 RepID=A0A562ZQD3_9BURK|nr:hypothetical protein [Caenimonas sedimenti]TWO70607.1 hypothetical protein FN976_13680 [Caenimonas sedimenti]